MIRVGITGGIGSGKSLVCQVFSLLGIPVYKADDIARMLMENDPDIRHDLISILGKDIYQGNSLDRVKMSTLIFNNPEILKKVNRVVHPRVAGDFLNWCRFFTQYPYVIHESAILHESDIYGMFDFILLVIAPEEVRIRRVLSRKGMTLEKVRSIMKNQLQEKEKIVRSHLVLNNDGKLLILPRILEFHKGLAQVR